jgi:hypothetical protein
MYFGTKNYLKSNRYNTAKHTQNERNCRQSSSSIHHSQFKHEGSKSYLKLLDSANYKGLA